MIETTLIQWAPCYRIIPSRFPTIDLFEAIADPADWDALFQLETITNNRIRDEVGDLSLVPVKDRVSGPGTSTIMAAFTHLNPDGSRFTDGTYGVFYAALEIETAIAETAYHRTRFMLATKEPPQELDMRVYAADLDADLHDLRIKENQPPGIYEPDGYAASQALAAKLRNEGANGLVYDSVRRNGGTCAAVFRPNVLSRCRQERHLCYVWDGQKIGSIYEKKKFEAW